MRRWLKRLSLLPIKLSRCCLLRWRSSRMNCCPIQRPLRISRGALHVNHGADEYVREDGRHTNTAESYSSLLNRGAYGTFHRISK